MSSKQYPKQAKYLQALAHPVWLPIGITVTGTDLRVDLIFETDQRQAYIPLQLTVQR